jgi:hypothetical protein
VNSMRSLTSETLSVNEQPSCVWRSRLGDPAAVQTPQRVYCVVRDHMTRRGPDPVARSRVRYETHLNVDHDLRRLRVRGVLRDLARQRARRLKEVARCVAKAFSASASPKAAAAAAIASLRPFRVRPSIPHRRGPEPVARLHAEGHAMQEGTSRETEVGYRGDMRGAAKERPACT